MARVVHPCIVRSSAAKATAEQIAVELIRLAARLRQAGRRSKASAVERRAESWIVRATLLAEHPDEPAPS